MSAYASFTRRSLARFVDLCVILAPCGLLYLLDRLLGFPVRYMSLFNYQRPESVMMFMTYDFPGVFITFSSIKLFLAYPYFALMESSRWQGTVGKLSMGIKVTDTFGNQISFGRATARYFLKIVSAMLFMLGYVISLSDRRQTWHDFMSRTLVLKKNVFPQYYAMPKIASRFMFDVPFISQRQNGSEVAGSVFECIFCGYLGKRDVACPNCGQIGYASHGVIRGMLLMLGGVFSVIGGLLVYVLSWVISERLQDYRLGREGTPVGVIFIIFIGCVFCLGAGLSSLCGKKWMFRLILLAFASRIRSR